MTKYQPPLSAADWEVIQNSLWRLTDAVAEHCDTLQSVKALPDPLDMAAVNLLLCGKVHLRDSPRIADALAGAGLTTPKGRNARDGSRALLELAFRVRSGWQVTPASFKAATFVPDHANVELKNVAAVLRAKFRDNKTFWHRMVEQAAYSGESLEGVAARLRGGISKPAIVLTSSGIQVRRSGWARRPTKYQSPVSVADCGVIQNSLWRLSGAVGEHLKALQAVKALSDPLDMAAVNLLSCGKVHLRDSPRIDGALSGAGLSAAKGRNETDDHRALLEMALRVRNGEQLKPASFEAAKFTSGKSAKSNAARLRTKYRIDARFYERQVEQALSTGEPFDDLADRLRRSLAGPGIFHGPHGEMAIRSRHAPFRRRVGK